MKTVGFIHYPYGDEFRFITVFPVIEIDGEYFVPPRYNWENPENFIKLSQEDSEVFKNPFASSSIIEAIEKPMLISPRECFFYFGKDLFNLLKSKNLLRDHFFETPTGFAAIGTLEEFSEISNRLFDEACELFITAIRNLDKANIQNFFKILETVFVDDPERRKKQHLYIGLYFDLHGETPKKMFTSIFAKHDGAFSSEEEFNSEIEKLKETI